jgi:putative toxin-antitoxin system antitoxin component (TIGR02293 family)
MKRTQALGTQAAIFTQIDIPKSVFNDKMAYIKVTREGLPGIILKQAIDTIGNRELFSGLLGISSPSNLSRLYQRKKLDKTQSENLLDTIHVFMQANMVFEDADKASEWMGSEIRALGNRTPVSLCDTFKGREMVEQALQKIEYGDFS